MSPMRGMPPRATVRLQLHRDFPFEAAREQLPYFSRLGISHLYLSPILRARAGSLHGYDVIDPTSVNPELGGEDGLRDLVADLRKHEMGLIVDIVPNHMAVGGHDNPWWLDVLRWGRDSLYAGFFDIDWDVPDPLLHSRVLTPFLGRPYGEALDQGEIGLHFDRASGSFHAAYFDHHFPIAPEHYAGLLGKGGEGLAAVSALFDYENSGSRATRRSLFESACRALAQAATDATIARAVQNLLESYRAEHPRGRALLHRLLEKQHYRLCWWRCAADEINWRRFFDVIDLAGLRVQDRAVFEAVHGKVFSLYEDGLLDGLRVDHVDGLADPRQYCRSLRQRLRKLAASRTDGPGEKRCYVIVEKILAAGERLARDWEVDGTTGYTFMNEVGAVLHAPEGEAPLQRLWSQRSGRRGDFADEERQARRRIPQELLAADFNACAHALHRLARAKPVTRDWSLGAVRRVLAELLVHFPVYRTYADARGRSAADQNIMSQVVAAARRSCRPGEVALVDLVDDWLGGTPPRNAWSPAERHARLRAIARFQQLTSPVAAKSVEDTAFYRYGTLLSRNEVGADPSRFSISVEEFHGACIERLHRFPAAMLATATHDHKRGEDLRARLAVLSEIPQGWAEAVERWSAMNRPLKPTIDGTSGPDATDEYLLYQMLVGAWPLELHADDRPALRNLDERLSGWQQKAVREAKRRSGWVEPNLAYEETCKQFLSQLLSQDSRRFIEELGAFVNSIAAAGAVNALSQALLRLSCPGVPDLYQGCELWDFSLVDPDNRRPVDFAARESALGAAAHPHELLRHWRNGQIKQHLIACLLRHRSQHAGLYARGRYLPLRIVGAAAPHLIAFLRELGSSCLLVLAPRLALTSLRSHGGLAPGQDFWRGTHARLPQRMAGRWRSLLNGEEVQVESGRLDIAEALGDWPLAALSL